MDKSGAELIDFWNKRAEHFPRFEEGEGYESSMLDLAKSRGVTFQGRRVLDVGCGSGMFTLRIAREALKVTGVDISERMLEISARDARALGLGNVELVRSGWLEYRPEEPFEVVFCSMCPGLREDPAKDKLLATPTEALVHIGFVEYFDPEPMARLIGHFKLERKRFSNALDMARYLDERGEPFERHPRRGHWTVKRSREGARQWCRTLLEDLGAPEADPAVIDRHLEPFWDPGLGAVVMTYPYHVEMLVWRPAGAR